MHLSQVNDAGQSVDARVKAGGFYTKLKTQQFVEFGHFLWDVDLIPERHRYAAPVDEPRGTICKDLVSSLQSRFEIDNDVVAETSLINKSSWPLTHDDAKTFGDDFIHTLIDQFCVNLIHAGVSIDKILYEWAMLKAVLYKKNFRQLTWQEINMQCGELAPNFLRLVDFILTIPATSAEAERGFNIMEMVKTNVKNRITEQSLNTLLRIILLSLDEDNFEPKKAINHWISSAGRRDNHTKPNDESPDSESDSATEEEVEPLEQLVVNWIDYHWIFQYR